MSDGGRPRTCDEVRDRFALARDGEGAAEERAAVLAHIETCAACAAEWRAFRETADRLRALATEPTDEERAALLEAAAPILEELRRPRADRPARRPRRRRTIRFALTAAAAAVLFFLLFQFTGPHETKLRSADVVLYDDTGAAGASFTAATFTMPR